MIVLFIGKHKDLRATMPPSHYKKARWNKSKRPFGAMLEDFFSNMDKYSRFSPKETLLAFFILTALGLIVGGVMFSHAFFLLVRGNAALGTITSDYNTSANCPRGDNSYYVRFKTSTGKIVDVEMEISACFSYASGERVPILYNPANPQQVQISSFPHLWLPPIGFTAVGIICGFCFCGLISVQLKKRRLQKSILAQQTSTTARQLEVLRPFRPERNRKSKVSRQQKRNM